MAMNTVSKENVSLEAPALSTPAISLEFQQMSLSDQRSPPSSPHSTVLLQRRYGAELVNNVTFKHSPERLKLV